MISILYQNSITIAIIAVMFTTTIVILRRIHKDFLRIKYPPSFRCVHTKQLRIDTRPTDDVVKHMFLYYLGLLLGYESPIYLVVLARINASFDSWDVPFTEQGLNAADEIRKYCKTWGMEMYDPANKHKWKWEKLPAEFDTMNEWFMRSFATKYSVKNVVKEAVGMSNADSSEMIEVLTLDSESRFHTLYSKRIVSLSSGNGKSETWQLIVSPAASVVSYFRDWRTMPRQFKNMQWNNLRDIGIGHRYLKYFESDKSSSYNSAMLMYLAPADYHCFHCPINGKIVSIFPGSVNESIKDLPSSVSVKEYMFGNVNIVARNRRCVLTFELKKDDDTSYYVAMVIVGGLTVDSIRMNESIVQIGNWVHRGERLGGFARGGSLIALFFSGEIILTKRNQQAALQSKIDNEKNGGHGPYGLFKLRCGDELGYFALN